MVNTCTVTAESDKKSRKAIRHFATLSHRPQVVVTGCMIVASPGAADDLCGGVAVLEDRDAVPAAIAGCATSNGSTSRGEAYAAATEADEVAVGAGLRTRVQLKAQDGCDCRCSYCIVPAARGGSRSVALSALGERAASLGAAGVREIVLTGIDLGSYAHDGHDLADALAVVATAGVERVRLSSIEPMHLSDRLTDLLTETDVFCRHLHIPLQSGSDRVLEEMGRPYTASDFLATISRLREAMPDLAVTSDLMVGFPSETEQDFEESLRVCREAEFAKIHVFRYSRRPGTPAAERADHIAPETAKERSRRARELASELRGAFISDRVGKEVEVLVERRHEDAGERWIGGTSREYIRVRVSDSHAVPGEIVQVRLLERSGEEVLGEMVRED